MTTDMSKNFTLSKSLYLRGFQCKKALWLKKYKKDVLTQPDEGTQAVFDTGSKIGDLACELFPNGNGIPYENTTFDKKIALTKQWMDDGVKDIYEAAFKYDDILVMVDILHRGDNGWEIYEVKSSTEVKDVYMHDASIQHYVLHGLGLDISKVSIIHIDNSYIRGDELEIERLFKIVDITEDVKLLQDNIPSRLQDFRICLSDTEHEPKIDIGTYCSSPYECDAKRHCWAHIPEYSIFDISGLRSQKKFELYNAGIVHFWQLSDISSFSASQQIQIESELENKEIINKTAIKEFLDTLFFPVYHLDFETFQQAVPQWSGISPYMQIPFQFSVHREDESGILRHFEFLASEGEDPRFELAKALVETIPMDACVLAYNMSFEKSVIEKLAAQFPQFAKHLMNIHKNIKDLMTPFKNKDYYAPSMRGSYSIKYVLPALVPHMEDAYKMLDLVHNGGEAMDAFARLQEMQDTDEKKRLRESLLRYCELDTLAMARVLHRLRRSMLSLPKGIVFTLPYGVDSVSNPEEYIRVLGRLISDIYADTLMHKSDYDEYFKVYILREETSQYLDEIENAKKILEKWIKGMNICVFDASQYANGRRLHFDLEESLAYDSSSSSFIEFISPSQMEIPLNTAEQNERKTKEGAVLNHLRLGDIIYYPYSRDTDLFKGDWNFVNLEYSKNLRFSPVVDRGLIDRLGIDLCSIGHVIM